MFIINMTAQPFARRIITQIGYDRTAEIHCLIAIVENDFRRIGIEQSSLPVGFRKRFYESGYLRRRVIETVDNILYLNGNYKKLTVYAMSGKQVYYSARPGETVSLSSLPAGIYSLRVEGEQGVQTMKFRVR